MASIYSTRLFSKGIFDPASGSYTNSGVGTAIIHDMIFYCDFAGVYLGEQVRLNVNGNLGEFTLWQLLAYNINSGATYHWTGRIVVPPGDGVNWTTGDVNDSLVGYGYYLTP
jgi:hypothetical protein